MTGATGDLTPDTIQSDFEPGELREVSDPAHQADVTKAQAARESGYGSEHGLSPEDPAYRMERRPRPKPEPEPDPARGQRDGGDERTDHEEHF